MSLKEGYALMSYEEDLDNRGMIEWVEGSPSLNTLNRYEGDLTLFDDQLVFEGVDNETKQDFIIKINRDEIEEIYFGFDDAFENRVAEEENEIYFEPLRITFFKEGIDRVIYLLTEFDPVSKTADNKDWYEDLEEWMEKEY